MFNIDKNIPIPPGKKNSMYPISKMEVGDSFFVKFENSGYSNIQSLHNTVATSVRMFRSLNKERVFLVKKMTDPIGIRVWRTT